MTNPRRIEWVGTYFVPNNERKAEIARLLVEDDLLTVGMGGPLAEQIDPQGWRYALDIGCGVGGWAIEAVGKYPELSIVGIDISPDIINVAQTRARAKHKSGRITFQIMDALEDLAFADTSFDLVNMRLGSTFLRTWDWPALLNEILRILRPGGTIRLTEVDLSQHSSSQPHARFFELLLQAKFNAGRLFEQNSTGLTAHLPRLLKNYGLHNVQSKVYPLAFKAGTSQGKLYYDCAQHARVILPFLQKWGSQQQDVEMIYQQMLADIPQKGFYATWNIHTVWGNKT